MSDSMNEIFNEVMADSIKNLKHVQKEIEKIVVTKEDIENDEQVIKELTNEQLDKPSTTNPILDAYDQGDKVRDKSWNKGKYVFWDTYTDQMLWDSHTLVSAKCVNIYSRDMRLVPSNWELYQPPAITYTGAREVYEYLLSKDSKRLRAKRSGSHCDYDVFAWHDKGIDSIITTIEKSIGMDMINNATWTVVLIKSKVEGK